MKSIFLFTLSVILLLDLNPLIAETLIAPCEMNSFPIKSVGKENKMEKFVGLGKQIEVIFKVYPGGNDQGYFSDSVLTFKNLKTKKTCDIKDGGIWNQNEVYLSSNESVAGLATGSGSGLWMEFYNTQTCKKMASTAEVGGGPIHITQSKIEAEAVCESLEENLSYCCPAYVYELDSQCLPKKSEKASRELTRKLHGVDHSKCVRVLDPGTSKAKVISSKE